VTSMETEMDQDIQKMATYVRKMFLLGKSKRLISDRLPDFRNDFFNAEDFQNAVSLHTLSHQDILFLEKRPVENYFTSGFQTQQPLDAKILEEKMTSGQQTVRVNSVWRFHAKLNALYQALNQGIRGEITINAYYSQKDSRSFAYHYDMCDCVILAMEGTKEWKFLDDTEEEEKFQKLVLNPSDGIFIPRGLIHKAKCISESCLHISFAYDPSGFFSQFWSKDKETPKTVFLKQ
jgi:hypothetical protein